MGWNNNNNNHDNWKRGNQNFSDHYSNDKYLIMSLE